jgi:sigma-54 dependent transcriptional regulator, acetoin dehydrogenase operon transcriptional activator AcoR
LFADLLLDLLFDLMSTDARPSAAPRTPFMRLNTPLPAIAGASPGLFFNTPQQRTALARERFFESGERPSGLVSEAVLQSWTRCMAARQSPRRAVAFDPVTRSRLQATLERSQALLQAASNDIHQLEAALAGTASRVLLTDAQGVIVHASAHQADPQEQLLNMVARLGVNLSEDHVGTNAPAVVVKTAQAVTVHGAEHYFSCVHTLHCAAAPIRDGQGRLAGVLDLTVQARPFAFDAAALVGVYATMIENRLLQTSAAEHLVLRFQVCSSLLGSPLEALVGVNSHGHVAWHNGTAQKLLGLAGQLSQDGTTTPALHVSTLFGLSLSQLQTHSLPAHSLQTLSQPAHSPQPAARPLRLPNGLTVWLQASEPSRSRAPARSFSAAPTVALTVALAVAPSRDDALASTSAISAGPAPALVTGEGPEPSPEASHKSPANAPTLGQLTSGAIERAVAECDGNISLAARRLGVSRGLVYRHLRAG